MSDLITLVGTIVDHEGATPLADVRITATPSQRVTQTSDGEEAVSDASATTDETGAFTLPLVYAEGLRYTIVYRAGGERLMRGVLDCDSYAAGATVDVAALPPIAGVPPSAVETLQAWFLAQLEALGEGGAVVSVNGQGGIVVLDAADVGAVADDDARLSDARTPTAHEHDDRYFTEAEVTASLALKSDTGHGHVINDITGLQAALDGKQAAGSYAAASHTHGVTDLTATGTKDATTFLRGDNTWAVPAGGGGGVTDHGALTGLGDDDHTQYALADGSRGSFAATSHTHVIADTTGLQTALDGKAATSHTHTVSQVTDAGDSAGLDVGTTAGTVAAGDHLHDARYVTVVEHGAVAGTARPAGATVVLWIGSVEPTNAVAGDQWDDASGSPSVYIEEPASEGTSGQVLTTDGAGGRSWTTVSGSGDVTAADVDSEAAADGYVLTADGAGGAAWEAAAGGGSDPWTYYVASAEVNNATTTLATATGLVIPSGLTAGTYQLDVQCLAKADAASAHKWTITKPTGGNLHFQWRIPTASTTVLQGSGIAAGGNAVATATGLRSWDWGAISFEAKGMLTVASSTSTSFEVQFAPDTASRTLTVMVGSYIAIRKIA